MEKSESDDSANYNSEADINDVALDDQNGMELDDNKEELNSLKENIINKYELDRLRKEYVHECNNIMDLKILLKHLKIGEEVPLLPDSFVKIINSLTIDDSNKKCLKISDENIKVFQFPENKIYIRKCYYEIFRHICKYLARKSGNTNIIIEGQPGIGKTSFIYVLLYFLKCNLLNDLKDEHYKEILKKKEYENEIDSINTLLNNNEVEKAERKKLLENEIKRIEDKNVKEEENIKIFSDDIKLTYKIIPSLFAAFIRNYFLNNKLYKLNKSKITKKAGIYELIIDNPEEKIINTKALIKNYCKGKYIYNVEEIKKLIQLHDLKEFKYLNKLKDNINGIQLEDKIICGYIVSKRILNRLNNIINLKHTKYFNNERKTQLNNDIGELEKKYKEFKKSMEEHIEKLKKLKDNINVNEVEIGDNLEIGFNNYFFKAKEKMKNIYIVKGKKSGDSNENKVYKYDKINGEYVLFKSDIEVRKIEDSLIIVDTCNCEFGKNNSVISISSPDKDNYKNYKINNSYKELFIDSLSNDEIKEWFDNCIDLSVNDDGEFKNVCERYGNIPRNVYFHYLYKRNYGRDFWDYYKQLIESVVGTTGYNDFVVNYMNKSNLERNHLSNIIMKYDLELEWNDELGCRILKPKDKLKFISDTIERYIVYKFYPPKDNDEYQKVLDYYESIDDLYMKRMAWRQIVSYELSTKMTTIDIIDPSFIINPDLQTPVHHPVDGFHSVYYILDENNYFDLIMEGVFIKLLFDEDIYNENDETKKQIEKSIEKYGRKKTGDYKYLILDKEKIVIKKGEITITASNNNNNNDINNDDNNTVNINNNNNMNNNINYTININNNIVINRDQYKVFVCHKTFCYMRDCFFKILEYLCPNNYNFKYQKNYLIFGHTKIGKTTLAIVIKEFIHKYYNNIRILHKYLNGNRTKYDKKYFKSEDSTKPYIVISDEAIIGEDDYADAKMIILIADASEETSKTFQSKRCPLVMYIPPFSKTEIKEVITISHPKLYVKFEDDRFIGYKEIESDKNYTSIDLEDYEKDNKMLTNSFKYYGGIIGNFMNIESKIKEEIYKVDKEMMKEMKRGILKSSFSRGKYNYLLIYDTDKNDITKSSHLRFISKEIERMIYEEVFSIKNNKDCIFMINVLNCNANGGLAGYLYEKVILYLMKNCSAFRENMIGKMCGKSNIIYTTFKKSFKKRKFEMIDIKDDDELKEKVKKFKDYYDNNTLPFMDLSYNSGFPDIDALFGPLGIQITISKSHTYAGEMTVILQFLYRLFTEGYDKVKNDFKKQFKNCECGFFFISPEEDVSLTPVYNRDVRKYPQCFQEMVSSLSIQEIDYFCEIMISKKATICFTFNELNNYKNI